MNDKKKNKMYSTFVMLISEPQILRNLHEVRDYWRHTDILCIFKNYFIYI